MSNTTLHRLSSEGASVHRAVCPHDCPDTCSMVVTLKEGKAVAIGGNPDHAFTRGVLCHKVSRYLERVYHPQRLTTPLRRSGPKGSGQFTPITWNEALDEIANRFREIATGPHGPQAILPYSYYGTMGRVQAASMDRRFFHRLGASILDRTICATAGMVGYSYTVGGRVGMSAEGFAESRLIINWGSNTAVTNSHLWILMHQARKRHGARIVTIDPYRSRTAARSDWHIAPRAGTDAAVALGIMHVLFRDKLADESYIRDYCIGGDELRGRVLEDYSPAKVATITGLTVAEIEQLGTEYGTISPAAIRLNYGLQRHRGGGMAVRTIACLPAIVGAWRHFGGGALLSSSGLYPINIFGAERPDLIPPGTRTVNMSELDRALHGELPGPPVKAMYVYNCNPAAVAPNLTRVKTGLLRDDLFTVVHDLFQTETADYADIVLPATSQLEHFDLHTSYGHHDVQVNVPVIAPIGESRCNTDVFRGLAKRLGFEDAVFQVSDQHLAQESLWEFSINRPPEFAGITVQSLTELGPQRMRLPQRFTPFAQGGFPTKSRRCELYSESMKQAGFDPLPTYTPPAEISDVDASLADRFPLQLLSPPSPHFLNSSFANMNSLMASAGRPELEIHPEDAAAREIADGDSVRVFNDRGEFFAAAVVAESVRPGLVVAPGIWWNKLAGVSANANATTSSRIADMGGGATFFDNLVEVEPADITVEFVPLNPQHPASNAISGTSQKDGNNEMNGKSTSNGSHKAPK